MEAEAHGRQAGSHTQVFLEKEREIAPGEKSGDHPWAALAEQSRGTMQAMANQRIIVSSSQGTDGTSADKPNMAAAEDQRPEQRSLRKRVWRAPCGGAGEDRTPISGDLNRNAQ